MAKGHLLRLLKVAFGLDATFLWHVYKAINILSKPVENKFSDSPKLSIVKLRVFLITHIKTSSFQECPY